MFAKPQEVHHKISSPARKWGVGGSKGILITNCSSVHQVVSHFQGFDEKEEQHKLKSLNLT